MPIHVLLLFFHRTSMLRDTHFGNFRVALCFEIDIINTKAEKEKRHHAKNDVSKLFSFYILPQCEHQAHRYQYNGNKLDYIREVSRVFEWNCRVGAKVSATIGTDLFNSDHA